MPTCFGTTHQDGRPGGGTGIAVHAGALYVEVRGNIVRYPLPADALAPTAEPDTILLGMPTDGVSQHTRSPLRPTGPCM
jgi:hypothetical protein